MQQAVADCCRRVNVNSETGACELTASQLGETPVPDPGFEFWQRGFTSDSFANDCAEIRTDSRHTTPSSGVYLIEPGEGAIVAVYCDMITDGGGWTVFQRRSDGSVDFYDRTWDDYAAGFGHPSSEYWLGNAMMHLLTSPAVELRVDMQDFEGESRFALYSTFSVGNAESQYELTVTGYNGTAGDSLTQHNNMKFSTPERDNDVHSSEHCAQDYKAGWWYHKCHNSNLNGLYLHGPYETSSGKSEGIDWYAWHAWMYSLQSTEMKFRPRGFSVIGN
ncbi:PREDICTED: fibrinogen-like protein 1 [Priapulus caudatus]|uniref:Fibrinogen-like protein 1 n=1 Tax=Priapulus caudatus TaxID=37621 RepID=A0ABM1F9Q2_PRICU|nr:PREDICTED: fibrinogen-like protein 1 [Priapulus caudatus]